MHLIGRTVAYLCCLTIFGFCEERSSLIEERSCDIRVVKFDMCQPTETCIQTSKGAFCRCRKDFERKEDGLCQPVPTEPTPTPASNNSSTDSGGFGLRLVLWLLVPVLLAILVAVLVLRQKMWLSRFYRLRVRSYNNVLVGSQDEDDPPIA